MSSRKKIHDDSVATIFLGFVFTVIIAVACGAVLFGIKHEDGWNFSKLFVFAAFIGAPLALASAMCLLIWHRRKFGTATLVVDDKPFRLGQSVSGEVQINRDLTGFSEMRICLKYQRVYPGWRTSGITRVKWQEEQTIPKDLVSKIGHQTCFPVILNFPIDGEPTRSAVFCYGEWVLEAETLPAKGSHFSTRFTLKVLSAE